HEQVEVSVEVGVEERRAGRPPWNPGALRGGHVLELEIAQVPEEPRAAERRDEEVRPAVPVEIRGIRALEPSVQPEAGLPADRLEAEGARLPVELGRGIGAFGLAVQRAAVADEEIERAVAVGVERGGALAEAFEDRRLPVDVAVDVLEVD